MTQTKRFGQPPTKFYLVLRQHGPRIREELGDPTLSCRIAARRLGIDRSLYLHARYFITEHLNLMLQAEATGDWTKVEAIVYAKIPHYRFYPSYVKAQIDVGAASRVDAPSLKTEPKKRGRPKGSKNKKRDELPAPALPEVTMPTKTATGGVRSWLGRKIRAFLE